MLSERALKLPQQLVSKAGYAALLRKQRETQARMIVDQRAEQIRRDNDPIERAILHLRRRGMVVFQAKVIEGPAGEGWVVGTGRYRTPEALLVRAAAAGWVAA